MTVMDFGFSLFTCDRGIAPNRAAVLCEQLGFATFYVPEHTHIPIRRDAAHPLTGTSDLPDDRYTRTLDPWVTIGGLAAVTSKIRLGTAVCLPVEHDPISLAKTIATADFLSGGRITIGVGYGWNTDELGDHMVPIKKRRTMLREYLEAMRQLWTEDEAEYHGEHIDFGPSWAWPKTVQPLGPPVIVGAAGNEKNFMWIARSADGWMTTPREDDISGNVALLRRVWTEAGREGSPRIIVLDGKPDPERLEKFRELGVDEVVYGNPDRSPEEGEAYLERLAGKIGLL